MQIRSFRKKKSLTQRELSEKIGVKRSTVAMWESGLVKPRADNLIAMARLFNCTTDELLRE